MTEHNVEHHTTLAGNMLDELVRMVGQDRADRAVALASSIKEQIGHVAEAAAQVAEPVDLEDFAPVVEREGEPEFNQVTGELDPEVVF